METNYCVLGKIYPDSTIRYGRGGCIRISKEDAETFKGPQAFFHLTKENRIIKAIRA